MLPEDLITKFGLKLTKDTVGVSFLHKARIFIWPALTDAVDTVFVMECDLEGVPLEAERAMIVARWPAAFKSVVITYEMMREFTPRQMGGTIHKMLQKKTAIKHNYRKQPGKKW